MTKYSDEFKIKAVQMALNGNAVKYVCRILEIPDSRPCIRAPFIETGNRYGKRSSQTYRKNRLLNTA